MNCALSPDNVLYTNALYRVIYDGVGHVLPCWLSYFVAGFVIMFILVNAVLLGAAVFVWTERRLIGRFHNRLGPNRWGPFGLLTPIADVLKLVFKEDLTPAAADRIVFNLVPITMLMPVILVMAVVPFAKNTMLADLNVGVLYILGVTSLTTLSVFMAGWSSHNRYSMFGAARGVAVLISYEVPLVLSLLGVVMLAGSLSLSSIVEAQLIPFILVQPLALFVFFASSSAELNRTPFDVAEAESELIAGYHTEYSGVKFALIQAAEMGGVLVSSAVMATLFLGGWRGPLDDYLGWLWFLAKLGVFVFMFIWIRATYPRLRIDQIMDLSWKFLLPLSVVNLAATGLEVYFLRDAQGVLTAGDLWLMAGINIVLAVVSIAIFGNFVKDKVQRRQPAAATRLLAGAPAQEVG